jgi:hypothetical protein
MEPIILYVLLTKLGHHPWNEPEAVEYLKKVDEKYGSTLATANMHKH